MSVRGSFYFRITSAGNLIGEYFNNYRDICLSESANRTGSGSGFAGNYITSWIERQNSALISRLTIEAISENMFSLVWADLNNEIIFRGKASLLEENIIYGYYSGRQFIQEH